MAALRDMPWDSIEADAWAAGRSEMRLQRNRVRSTYGLRSRQQMPKRNGKELAVQLHRLAPVIGEHGGGTRWGAVHA